jgi:hypothetical protein
MNLPCMSDRLSSFEPLLDRYQRPLVRYALTFTPQVGCLVLKAPRA